MSKPKVVILCGGRGTRINEETEFKPKPLVEIGGKPILWHIMSVYAHYGFNEFVLCLGYKGNMIKEYFLNYNLYANDFTMTLNGDSQIDMHTGNHLDWKITFADTGLNSLKGSRLKQIEKYIYTDNFFLTYGDGVADVNINSLLEFHQKHNKTVTLSGVRPPSRFGDILIDKDSGKILEFTEKSQASAGMINGGFFVLNRKVFAHVNADQNCDFEYGPLEDLAQNGEVMAYQHPGSWECMDNVREMQHLNKLWDSGKAFWKVW
ncbi:glucose-1-phosphate cytidylyltransferase [Candidatus Margulisiibacteriota bacterium]